MLSCSLLKCEGKLAERVETDLSRDEYRRPIPYRGRT